jgi:hypothetical protein
MFASSLAALFSDSITVTAGFDEILFLIISFAIILGVMSVVSYSLGNIVIGRKKVNLKEALYVSILGSLILIVCLSFVALELTLLLSFAAWLILVKYYYESGFAGAVAVAVTSAFVSLAILEILSVIFNFPLLFDWIPLFITI